MPFRDKVVALAAPFTGAAGRNRQDRVALRRHQLHRHRHRAADRERSRDAPHAHAGSWSRARRRGRCGTASRTRPTTIPGTPVTRRDTGGDAGGGGGRGGAGGGSIIQNGDFIYVAGDGASPEGDRPFLDG